MPWQGAVVPGPCSEHLGWVGLAATKIFHNDILLLCDLMGNKYDGWEQLPNTVWNTALGFCFLGRVSRAHVSSGPWWGTMILANAPIFLVLTPDLFAEKNAVQEQSPIVVVIHLKLFSKITSYSYKYTFYQPSISCKIFTFFFFQEISFKNKHRESKSPSSGYILENVLLLYYIICRLSDTILSYGIFSHTLLLSIGGGLFTCNADATAVMKGWKGGWPQFIISTYMLAYKVSYSWDVSHNF